MTADEARRLTISNYPPQRLKEYNELKEVIKKHCLEPKRRAFEVHVKGEIEAVTKLALDIDGFNHYYDDSELITRIHWWPESEWTKNFRVEKAIKDLIEYLDKTRSQKQPLEENDKN